MISKITFILAPIFFTVFTTERSAVDSRGGWHHSKLKINVSELLQMILSILIKEERIRIYDANYNNNALLVKKYLNSLVASGALV